MWYREVLGKNLRIKRFILFKDKINKLNKPLKILEIGGTYKFWADMDFLDEKVSITLLNLNKEVIDNPLLISVVGDATDLSGFSDNEFDVVFSNSTIEHLFTLENQIQMANEAMRVGVYIFIQTPNRYFPIEPHYFFPFFQFMPFKMKKLLMMKTKLVLWKYHKENSVQRAHDEIRLLSKKELIQLFPNAEIFNERVFCLVKSFMITNL